MQIAKQHLIFFKLYEALLDAGVNKQKAEAAIQEIAENIPSKLEQNSILEKIATKEDLKDVKEDIKKLELKLEFFRASRKLQMKIQTKTRIYFFGQTQNTQYFFCNICFLHKNMGIVLMKSAYSKKPSQSSF